MGQTITETAERVGAPMIVLGSRANHGLRSLALGSVSRQVVHDARRPTLVVPVRSPATDLGESRRGDPRSLAPD